MNTLPDGSFVVGDMRFAVCPRCEQTVKFKFLLGSLHICLTDEEWATKQRLAASQRHMQQLATSAPDALLHMLNV